MPVDPKHLRRWFAAAAIFVVVVCAGFYVYARLRIWKRIERAKTNFGIEVQQSTQGFTLSKSEAGRTIFTVHASQAVQYKEGGRAELHDVSILIYGRRADRFDQIHGADFEYDPGSGDIIAHGEVNIDLEGNAQGPVRPDQATPFEQKNPIHLTTSGLVFNQKTGAATTRERVQLRITQASGSALGASYDSKSNSLTLGSDVRVRTAQGADLVARHAVIAQNPRRAILDGARMERKGTAFAGDQVTLLLRDDNSISRIVAGGHVQGTGGTNGQGTVEAAEGEFLLGERSQVQSGTLYGGVTFAQTGASAFHGSAGRADLQFGPRGTLSKILAKDDVHFVQDQQSTASRATQTVELASDALDMALSQGHLERGVTGGAARITVRPLPPDPSKADTVVTAGRFDMTFGAGSRLASMHGEPDARVVSSTAGQPDKVSTSRTLDVAFNPANGEISSFIQRGDVRYSDGQRNATSDNAHYQPAESLLVLEGSPRWVEGDSVTSAHLMRFKRDTGEAFAEGEVKTTYGGQPKAGRPADDAIHVTANRMTARRETNIATYTGSARLWQGSNMVEAPVIEFDQAKRVVVGEGAPQQVETALVQRDSHGKLSAVTVTSAHLTYSDSLHQAAFQGKVLMKSAEGTVSADQADVLLKPKDQVSGSSRTPEASQIEQVIAQGHVVLQQPSRKAVGNKLVYTASEGKYVLTGGSPSIIDAERGSIRGDSLTFYNRNDTVLVGSQTAVPTVTQTHTGK